MISALHIYTVFLLGSFFGYQTGVHVFVDGKVSPTFLYSDALVTKNEYSVYHHSFGLENLKVELVYKLHTILKKI